MPRCNASKRCKMCQKAPSMRVPSSSTGSSMKNSCKEENWLLLRDDSSMHRKESGESGRTSKLLCLVHLQTWQFLWKLTLRPIGEISIDHPLYRLTQHHPCKWLTRIPSSSFSPWRPQTFRIKIPLMISKEVPWDVSEIVLFKVCCPRLIYRKSERKILWRDSW